MVVGALMLGACPAEAQFLGHNTPGDFGLQSGSQAPPGLYLIAPLYVRYDSDTLRNGLGNALPAETEINVNAYVFGVTWVSNAKVLGANYSFQFYLPFTNNALEAPILGIDQSTDTGLTDLYVQPINLGWHTKNADFIAGLGIFAPTGRYESGADDNLGLGMWSFELFGGATFFFDEAKSWHVATTAFYETHTGKEGSVLQAGHVERRSRVLRAVQSDRRRLRSGSLAATNIPAGEASRVRGRSRGVDTDRLQLYGFLNFRYLWETGVRNNLEGNLFVVTASFPVPSPSLQ
jgi:hypothetical protein